MRDNRYKSDHIVLRELGDIQFAYDKSVTSIQVQELAELRPK